MNVIVQRWWNHWRILQRSTFPLKRCRGIPYELGLWNLLKDIVYVCNALSFFKGESCSHFMYTLPTPAPRPVSSQTARGQAGSLGTYEANSKCGCLNNWVRQAYNLVGRGKNSFHRFPGPKPRLFSSPAWSRAKSQYSYLSKGLCSVYLTEYSGRSRWKSSQVLACCLA